MISFEYEIKLAIANFKNLFISVIYSSCNVTVNLSNTHTVTDTLSFLRLYIFVLTKRKNLTHTYIFVMKPKAISLI